MQGMGPNAKPMNDQQMKKLYKQPVGLSMSGESQEHRVPASEELEKLYKFQKLMGDLNDYANDENLLKGVQNMPGAQQSFNMFMRKIDK